MSNDIRDIFQRFRTALNEAENENSGEWYNNKQNGVPYTQQDEMLQTSMQTAKEQFGADFSNIKTQMFYYKSDDDITFSGEIPTLNDARFQFSYKSYPNGCYFWSGNGQIEITPEVVTKLSRMYGVYKNWVDELNNSEDRKPMTMRNEM
jgi:hypothetical protein